MLLAAMGCSSDDGPAAPPPNTNKPPTVNFTYNKIAVAKSDLVTLTVTTDDPDGDPVSVRWEVTRGQLNPADQGSESMRWTTVGTVGTDTLTITASDGQDSTTITEALDVGTGKSTNIGGTTTWTLAGSPYLIRPSTDKFSVLPGGRLTIDAGVVVYIDKSAIAFEVDAGTLTIGGTFANPVVVKPNSMGATPGFWEGFLGSGSQPLFDFNEVTISHAINAIKAVSSSDVHLTSCRITLSREDAVLHESSGELVVENCDINNNRGAGIRVQLIASQPELVTIRFNDVAFNGRFSDSEIYGDGEAGITLDFNDPGRTVSVTITNNEISRNDFPGIRLRTAVFATITNNGIFGNEFRKTSGKINLEVLDPFVSGEINGTNNWWGFAYPSPADSVLLKQTIIDADDNSSLNATVSVSPWRNTGL